MATATPKKEEKRSVEAPKLSEAEADFRSLWIKRCEQAKTQREQSHVEFDGMTYRQWWESNAKAANAFIYPKLNPEDVRITSGTTREKKNTLLANLMNFDYVPTIEAYDGDDKVVIELGETMNDLVRKSRDIEEPDYDLKKLYIYNEYLSQGTVFVEEKWHEYSIPDKEIEGELGKTFSEMKWVERMSRVAKMCSAELINGMNLYLGNIREPFIQLQPFVFSRKLRTREEVEPIYGDWERWKNVPYEITKVVDDGSDATDFNNWSLETFEYGLVEELRCYDRWNNNFMIYLNGVPMFPVKRHKGRLSTMPLSALLGECVYPIAKADYEPIATFAYSKSVPAKMKVDQQVFDEMMRNVILAMRKRNFPPLANNTGYTLPKSIMYPNTIHDGVNPEKIQSIGNNEGVTQADLAGIQFLKQIIDEKSVAPIMQGQTPQKKQAVRTTLEQKRQAQISMGLAILGIINLEKQLIRLRIPNILTHWTEVVDKTVTTTADGIKKEVKRYQSFSVNSTLDDGEKGKRIIEFTEELPHERQIMAREDLMTEQMGEVVRLNYVKVDELGKIKLSWNIDVMPTEKDASELKAALLEETIAKIGQLAPEMLNKEYAIRKIALNAHLDPDKLIKKVSQGQAEGGMPQGGQPPEGGGAPPQGGGEMPTTGVADKMKVKQTPRPSINTMG